VKEIIHPDGLAAIIERLTTGYFDLPKLLTAPSLVREYPPMALHEIVHIEAVKFLSLDGETSPRNTGIVKALLWEALGRAAKPENQGKIPEIREQLLSTLSNSFPEQAEQVRQTSITPIKEPVNQPNL